MHAVNLGGSHYAQYLGMSAGIAALVLALQPLVTAMVAAPLLGERLARPQWIGVALGLIGVALVVWHKIDLNALTAGALIAVTIALVAITAGTLYQRILCPAVDLRAASVVQFVASFVVLAPLAVWVEDFRYVPAWPMFGAIAFLVIFASILAVNALHTLMRRGEATRVTSLLYLTPIIAVALEWAHVRRPADAADHDRHRRHLRRRGDGGVAAARGPERAMTLRMRHIMVFIVLTHTSFGAARLTGTLYALSNKASAFTVGVQMALFALVPALLAVRAGRWLDTSGPFRPLLLGTSLMTAGALLPALFPYEVADIAPLLVASALLGTGFMYVQITAQHVVGSLAAPDRRPAAFSMLALAFSTSGLIAPVGSGFLIDSIGHRATLACDLPAARRSASGCCCAARAPAAPHAAAGRERGRQSVRPVPRARGAARADHRAA